MRDLHGRTDGPPPPVDLAQERKVGDFVRSLIERGLTRSVHDVSDGGLAVALAEMAMASGIGATVPGLEDIDPVPVFFGEDQNRYLVAMDLDPQDGALEDIWREAEEAGIFAPWIGTTGGSDLKLAHARPVAVSDLIAAHESWFPSFMENEV
jgi:phosphoribosylformylglycinamidine synthase